MPSTDYAPNQQLETLVAEVIQLNDFHLLRQHDLSITSCLKIKIKEDGEYAKCKGDPVQVKKVSGPFAAFIEHHFIVVYDAYEWNNFESRRSAQIHRALMRIKVKVSDSGNLSFGTRQPDIQEFEATLRHYGPYNEGLTAIMRAAEALRNVV